MPTSTEIVPVIKLPLTARKLENLVIFLKRPAGLVLQTEDWEGFLDLFRGVAGADNRGPYFWCLGCRIYPDLKSYVGFIQIKHNILESYDDPTDTGRIMPEVH